jgi:hypothetical protein
MKGGLLADFSHCTYDAKKRVLTCDFASSAYVPPNGCYADTVPTDTSPTPPLRCGATYRAIFAAIGYKVHFHFDETLQRAEIISEAFGTTLPFLAQRYAFTETLEKGSSAVRGAWLDVRRLRGAWVRNNYSPPSASTPSTGYMLLPLLTPGWFRPRLHRAHLRAAEKKNPAGDVVLRWI